MKLSAHRYRLPLATPFQTGRETFSEREGIILCMEADGIRSYGEAAPLPGFSGESLEEVLTELAREKDNIYSLLGDRETGGIPSAPSLTDTLSPALGFALDTLQLDRASNRERRTLRELLFDGCRNSIPVNAALGIEAPEALLETARSYWEEGYRTFKVKTGRDFERELHALRLLRDTFDGCRIRIDANRSWEYAEAETNLGRLRDQQLELEYCEEPLRNPDPGQLRSLERTTEIPIALDETLYRSEAPEQLVKNQAGRILIVKPMVLGSLHRIENLCRLAVEHGCTPIFTTSLESGIGRMMTAVLAAGLGSSRFAHGLATGDLFTMDVWSDRAYIGNGSFTLPDGYGLGSLADTDLGDIAFESIDF